jgi:drug/metabolite transporter (DMT)-like permease
MPPALRALPALLLLGAIWGLTPALAKLLVQGGMPALGLAALVATLSAALLRAACAARGIRVPLDAAHLRHYAVTGLAGFALANVVSFTALRHVPAGLFALLVPLSPMLTMLLAALLGMERATPRRLLGTALGLAGTALAMAPGAALPEARLLPWALLLLVTPAGYATANVLAIRLAPPGTPSLALATGMLAGAAVFAWVPALLLGAAALPAGAGLGVLAAQAGLTALAYILYFRLLTGIGGVGTSQVGYLVTLSGLFWGFLFFGEQPGWLTVPAAGLIFAGLALVTLPPRRRG